MRRAREHLTYANVIATIALFGVIAGGGAYAASKIGSADIKSQAVTRPKLDAKAVSSGKIADAAVGSAQLSPDTDGVALAGVTVRAPGELLNYFNRVSDGAPRVERTSVGNVAIYIPGMENTFATEIIESVTSLDGGRVSVEHTSCSGACLPDHPVVTTQTPDGSPADRSFTYVVYAAANP
ncbi:MAG: hypothetical protein QOI10_1558 [Solirubrobacterales bacterium]|jgi:hypothetical protein|nr:hypothetical protein [Solirubrobacterales bacterium]